MIPNFVTLEKLEAEVALALSPEEEGVGFSHLEFGIVIHSLLMLHPNRLSLLQKLLHRVFTSIGLPVTNHLASTTAGSNGE